MIEKSCETCGGVRIEGYCARCMEQKNNTFVFTKYKPSELYTAYLAEMKRADKAVAELEKIAKLKDGKAGMAFIRADVLKNLTTRQEGEGQE